MQCTRMNVRTVQTVRLQAVGCTECRSSSRSRSRSSRSRSRNKRGRYLIVRVVPAAVAERILGPEYTIFSP